MLYFSSSCHQLLINPIDHRPQRIFIEKEPNALGKRLCGFMIKAVKIHAFGKRIHLYILKFIPIPDV
ncbi:hypothetical protein D3C76_204640 [compost metagenome]